MCVMWGIFSSKGLLFKLEGIMLFVVQKKKERRVLGNTLIIMLVSSRIVPSRSTRDVCKECRREKGVSSGVGGSGRLVLTGEGTRPFHRCCVYGSERNKECCTFASASKSREEEEEEVKADPSCVRGRLLPVKGEVR